MNDQEESALGRLVQSDYEQLEAKMYVAIKGLLKPWPEGQLTNAVDAEQYALAVIAEYELNLGPIPDWSYGHNVLRVIQQGTQLQTKDGRRIGNAWVTSNAMWGPAAKGEESPKYFDVFTDAGSKCTMNEKEIHQLFWIGPFFSDPERVFRQFGRGED